MLRKKIRFKRRKPPLFLQKTAPLGFFKGQAEQRGIQNPVKQFTYITHLAQHRQNEGEDLLHKISYKKHFFVK